MTTKKIPISFNDKDQKDIAELSKLLGVANQHGDIAKTVKFGIQFALSAIKSPHKVYSGLDEEKLEWYLSSVRVSELLHRIQKNQERLKEIEEKV